MNLTSASLTLALTAVGLAAQQEPPPQSADQLLERFRRLDRDQKSTVVRNMERRVQRSGVEELLRIAGFERGLTAYGKPTPRTFFRTADYAPVAKKRRVIKAGSTTHRRATRSMTPFLFEPKLQRAVDYDWQQGKAIALNQGLDDQQRFANYVHGYAPGADHAIARIVELLDSDAEQRQLADYFEHVYADRNGGVYAGVSMYDAWYSGKVVEMPDTDAIAYARDILHTQSFVSPIPNDRRRTRLYEKVREGFTAHREYRTLRLAAATTFVVAHPELDLTYEPLIRRCRWLWLQCGYDVEKFRATLIESGDRAGFLAEIDRAIAASPEVVDDERALLRERAQYLRALAQRELDAMDG